MSLIPVWYPWTLNKKTSYSFVLRTKDKKENNAKRSFWEGCWLRRNRLPDAFLDSSWYVEADSLFTLPRIFSQTKVKYVHNPVEQEV